MLPGLKTTDASRMPRMKPVMAAPNQEALASPVERVTFTIQRRLLRPSDEGAGTSAFVRHAATTAACEWTAESEDRNDAGKLRQQRIKLQGNRLQALSLPRLAPAGQPMLASCVAGPQVSEWDSRYEGRGRNKHRRYTGSRAWSGWTCRTVSCWPESEAHVTPAMTAGFWG